MARFGRIDLQIRANRLILTNRNLIDVTVYQSRSAITVPQAYKNAIRWELDYLNPEVFTMAGARNPHPTFISRKTPP